MSNEDLCASSDPSEVTDENGTPLEGAVLRRRFLSMRHELRLLKTAGVVEVACLNPNVMDALKHWESRALKAEAELEARNSIPTKGD